MRAALITKIGAWPLWLQVLAITPLAILAKLLVFTDRPRFISQPQSPKDWLIISLILMYAGCFFVFAFR